MQGSTDSSRVIARYSASKVAAFVGVSVLAILWTGLEVRQHGWTLPAVDAHDLGTIVAAIVSFVLSIVSSGLLCNAVFAAGVAIRYREGEFVFYWPLGWKRVLLQSGLSVGSDERTFRSRSGLIERVSAVNAGVERLVVEGAGQPRWTFARTLLREGADVIIQRMSEVLDDHAAPPP